MLNFNEVNSTIANSTIKLSNKIIEFMAEDELLQFTLKQLPKLYYLKNHVEETVELNFMDLAKTDTEENICIILNNQFGEECAKKFTNANTMVNEIATLYQKRRQLANTGLVVQKVVEKFFMDWIVTNGSHDEIDVLKVLVTNKSDKSEDIFADITTTIHPIEKEKILSLIKTYDESPDNTRRFESGEELLHLDIVHEVNKYYISCCMACHDIFERFRIHVI
jgi:hypothetical protein